MSAGKDAYAQAGVDIDEANLFVEMVKEIIQKEWPGTEKEIGGFSGGTLIPLHAKRVDSSTDSVGTKLQLATILAEHPEFNKKHGINIDWLYQAAQDLMAMVAVDVFMGGNRPENFIDFLAFEKLKAAKHIAFFEGLVAACKLAGCRITGGETAEIPGTYVRNYFFEAVGFCNGFPDNLLSFPVLPKPGNQLWGLLSYSPASNGYSLLRKAAGLVTLRNKQAKESKQLAQLGRFKDQLGGKTFAEAAMVPTPIYINNIYRMIEAGTVITHMSHITGGGLLENPPRGFPDYLQMEIYLDSWKRPAIFNFVEKKINVSRRDMLRTYNNGIMILLVVDDDFPEPDDPHCVHIGTVSGRIGKDQVIFHGDFNDSV